MTRYYLRLPGHETVEDAQAFADRAGMVLVRVELGPDGKVRGLAMQSERRGDVLRR